MRPGAIRDRGLSKYMLTLWYVSYHFVCMHTCEVMQDKTSCNGVRVCSLWVRAGIVAAGAKTADSIRPRCVT